MQGSQRPRIGLSQFFRDCFAEEAQGPTFKMLAGGRWTESSSHKVLEVRSPIDGSVVAREKAGSAADAQTAVEAAHDARRKIRDVPAIDRIDMPNRARHIVADHSEDFERTLVLEGGESPSVRQKARSVQR